MQLCAGDAEPARVSRPQNLRSGLLTVTCRAPMSIRCRAGDAEAWHASERQNTCALQIACLHRS
eukprot:scaffold124364_cov25-Tisochrysis_lutea.AAC.7